MIRRREFDRVLRVGAECFDQFKQLAKPCFRLPPRALPEHHEAAVKSRRHPLLFERRGKNVLPVRRVEPLPVPADLARNIREHGPHAAVHRVGSFLRRNGQPQWTVDFDAPQ